MSENKPEGGRVPGGGGGWHARGPVAGERLCSREQKRPGGWRAGGGGRARPVATGALSEKHGELLGGSSGLAFSSNILHCVRFAGAVLVSWVTGVGGKTDELTVRMAQIPAPSLSSF